MLKNVYRKIFLPSVTTKSVPLPTAGRPLPLSATQEISVPSSDKRTGSTRKLLQPSFSRSSKIINLKIAKKILFNFSLRLFYLSIRIKFENFSISYEDGIPQNSKMFNFSAILILYLSWFWKRFSWSFRPRLQINFVFHLTDFVFHLID